VKTLIGRGSGETIQVAFEGTGWVLVQPSEGRVSTSPLGGGGGGRRLDEGPRRLSHSHYTF
jgi:hypothetical protein